MKKIFYSFVIMSMALIGFMPASQASAITSGTSVDLIAGQNMVVGTVTTTNDSTNLYVKYELNANAISTGWLITATHLAVSTTRDGIPQTTDKNGNKNPIPGKFAYSMNYDPAVTEYEYTIPMASIGANTGTSLFVAAHADVKQFEEQCTQVQTGTTPETLTIVSDTTTLANGNPAVGAWTHPAWTASIPGATWIWDSYYVQDPLNGETVEFTRSFNIDGTVTSATIDVASDNTYAISVNGVSVGSSADLNNFQSATQDSYPVTNLVSGTNSLAITAGNAAWPTTDPEANPAGLLYRLIVNYDKPVYATVCEDVVVASESAWGAGERFTPKGNWATYFKYGVAKTLAGSWTLNVNGGAFMHDMIIVSQSSTGALTGTGGYPVSGPLYAYPYNWTLVGQLTGNSITMTITYQNGYTATITGTVDTSLDYMSGGAGTGGVSSWSATR